MFKKEWPLFFYATDSWGNHGIIGGLDKRCFMRSLVGSQTRVVEDRTRNEKVETV